MNAAGSLEPLLIPGSQAAALCGRSLRTWRSWHAAGLVPPPVRVGSSLLWRRDELRTWIVAGCPRRKEWTATLA